ncbi:LOW QUALITY PROTEIN: small ribosomal subunit protein eS10B-like [Onychostoma macrolepis]|uniref:LOW QUALITY PROTEIN: small ribosomal subunit protein eS10B-like n=1 Tax=Onychostoma macrolepis TaxID=369639 RepID=UPI00272A3B0B|nr:LOW QUALITY PROTEIN: small ribosomal subunit protein eS10B-like [Onychostoma macrolepis]
MVAGMVMPLDNLKAIYEHLFRDGVIVAKKDKRPQTKHPEIPGVDNLQVIRAMGSLKSRGYVRETFAWKHYYWYLTNEGIVYLRDYLHLPPEIVPTPLQRVQRPAASGHRPQGRTGSNGSGSNVLCSQTRPDGCRKARGFAGSTGVPSQNGEQG